jgi:hypothetical protein
MGTGEGHQYSSVLCKGAQAYSPKVPILDVFLCTDELVIQLCVGCSYYMTDHVCAANAPRAWGENILGEQRKCHPHRPLPIRGELECYVQ